MIDGLGVSQRLDDFAISRTPELDVMIITRSEDGVSGGRVGDVVDGGAAVKKAMSQAMSHFPCGNIPNARGVVTMRGEYRFTVGMKRRVRCPIRRGKPGDDLP